MDITKLEKLSARESTINEAIKGYQDYFFKDHFPNVESLKDYDRSSMMMISFIKNIPSEGIDTLKRLIDSFNFLTTDIKDSIVNLLKTICQNSLIKGCDRIYCAVTLFNLGYINYCYECFADISCDDKCDIEYRTEACKYLFSSDIDSYKEIAQEAILEILEDRHIHCEDRYRIIMSYNSNNGIRTVLNSKKLNIPFDQEFIFGLQSAFFNNTENDVRYRLLSGQHLLQLSLTEQDTKDNIIKEFLEIGSNINYEENIRADAFDIVLRLGKPNDVDKARTCLKDLGYAGISTGKTFSERIKTVYSSSQNIHDEKITDAVTKFIEKVIKENKNLLPFQTVYDSVSALIRKYKFKAVDRIKIIKALNRVSMDTATFTKHNVTVAEIFVHIWMRIETYDEQDKIVLEQRLLEELVEMSDTCSSGHIGRFVNVLSGIDSEISISFESQIKANVAGRMDARIRNLKEEERNAVSMGMLEEADDNDKRIYNNFIKKSLTELEQELRDEFVPKYVTSQQFENYFLLATEGYIL